MRYPGSAPHMLGELWMISRSTTRRHCRHTGRSRRGCASASNRASSPGRRLPSENDIMQMTGVAATTVRRAVALLRQQGLVYTVPGREPTWPGPTRDSPAGGAGEPDDGGQFSQGWNGTGGKRITGGWGVEQRGEEPVGAVAPRGGPHDLEPRGQFPRPWPVRRAQPHRVLAGEELVLGVAGRAGRGPRTDSRPRPRRAGAGGGLSSRPVDSAATGPGWQERGLPCAEHT